jgi:hypothetical protein
MFRIIFIITLLFGYNIVQAQDVHPLIDKEISQLNLWIQTEINTKGSIDEKVLNEKNAFIKYLQDSLSNVIASDKSYTPTQRSVKNITKSVFAGSSIQVPDNVEWRVLGVYVKNDQDPYRIEVKSVEYKSVYFAKEYLNTPAMSSEAALLGGDAMSAIYEFQIIETLVK